MQNLSKLLNIVKVSLQKWRENLVRRFEKNFSFLGEESTTDSQKLKSFEEVSQSLWKLAKSEVTKFLGVAPVEKKPPKRGMYSSTIMTNIFNRSLSASKRRKTVKNPKAHNFRLFEAFADSLDFDPSKLSVKSVLGERGKEMQLATFQELAAKLKDLRDDKSLFETLVLVKLLLKTQIKKLSESKAVVSENVLISSDLFSQNKTVSIKRNSSSKKVDLPNAKTNTEKRCYENRNLENIKVPQKRSVKLGENGLHLRRNHTLNSTNSVNSQEVHVKDFEQRNPLKSHFSNEVSDPLLPEISNGTNLLRKAHKTEAKRGESIKNMLVKSYNSTQFQKLKSPRKMMLLSQKLGKYMCSARSLISQDSVGLHYNTSIVPFEDLGESVGVVEQKKRHRKRAIDRSQSKGTQISGLHDRRQPRESSLGFGMQIASRDLLSVEKSVSKVSNPFLLTSDFQYPQGELSRKYSTSKMKTLEIGRNKSRNQLKKDFSGDLIDIQFNTKPKPVAKKSMKGHQKFASVNLDYLRLKTSKTEINDLKSEISNMIEEEPRYHLKAKKYQKTKDSPAGNLLMMKSLVTRVSNSNYSKILNSGLCKAKKKKSGKKKKRKINFQTLQSNVNNLNYFNTNTYKTKTKSKKVSSRNKSNTLKHSRRKIKNVSGLKKKGKDKSIGSIPSLRIFPKQIKLKGEIKQILVNKTRTKKGTKNSSKMRFKDPLKTNLYAKQLTINSSKKLTNAYKIKNKNVQQKVKKVTSIIGKIKKNVLNVSGEKSFKLKNPQKDFFKSKRKSDVNGYHFDSNLNNKLNEKFTMHSGDGKKKKKNSKMKHKLGHFFSYLGYTGEFVQKKSKKKPEKKQKNMLNHINRKF